MEYVTTSRSAATSDRTPKEVVTAQEPYPRAREWELSWWMD